MEIQRKMIACSLFQKLRNELYDDAENLGVRIRDNNDYILEIYSNDELGAILSSVDIKASVEVFEGFYVASEDNEPVLRARLPDEFLYLEL